METGNSKEADGSKGGGEPLRLYRETRWNRILSTADGKRRVLRSRFEDGSAKISLSQLTAEWPSWTDEERKDFCDSIQSLPNSGRTEILQFLLKNAAFHLLSNNVIEFIDLPSSEVTPWLIRGIEKTEPGKAINFLQALAHTKSPHAGAAIRQRLNILRRHPEVLRDDPFVNWVALEVLHCVQYLIELQGHPQDYAEEAMLLSGHPCARVRGAYVSYISAFFE